jgi:hypothetical protein
VDSPVLSPVDYAKFTDDIKALGFEGFVVTGRHELVSIDLMTARVSLRKHPGQDQATRIQKENRAPVAAEGRLRS